MKEIERENKLNFSIYDFQSTDNCSVPQQSGIITSGLKTDEQRKADLFSTMGKLSHGTQAHSQMIDGILYDQVLSGEQFFSLKKRFWLVRIF